MTNDINVCIEYIDIIYTYNIHLYRYINIKTPTLNEAFGAQLHDYDDDEVSDYLLEIQKEKEIMNC